MTIKGVGQLVISQCECPWPIPETHAAWGPGALWWSVRSCGSDVTDTHTNTTNQMNQNWSWLMFNRAARMLLTMLTNGACCTSILFMEHLPVTGDDNMQARRCLPITDVVLRRCTSNPMMASKLPSFQLSPTSTKRKPDRLHEANSDMEWGSNLPVVCASQLWGQRAFDINPVAIRLLLMVRIARCPISAHSRN